MGLVFHNLDLCSQIYTYKHMFRWFLLRFHCLGRVWNLVLFCKCRKFHRIRLRSLLGICICREGPFGGLLESLSSRRVFWKVLRSIFWESNRDHLHETCHKDIYSSTLAQTQQLTRYSYKQAPSHHKFSDFHNFHHKIQVHKYIHMHLSLLLEFLCFSRD